MSPLDTYLRRVRRLTAVVLVFVVLSAAYFETFALVDITDIAGLGSASYLLYGGPVPRALVIPLVIWVPMLVAIALLGNVLCRGLTRDLGDADRRARFNAALHDLDRAILAASDENEILAVATERMKTLLNCDRVEISIDARAPGGTENGDQVYREEDAALASTKGHTRVIPLVAHGERLGTLSLACRPTDALGTGRGGTRLAQEFATEIAMALHHARLRRQAEESRASIQLNRLKEEFISTASHELRTPLTAIVGFGELLVAGRVPLEEEHSAIEHMYRSALHLAKLVEDLLDVSRLDGGRLRLYPRRADLVGLVRQVAEEMGGAGQSHQVAVDGPLEPIWVDVDERRMRQILMNLIGNAIRYSPRGEPIAIRVEQRESDVLVTVEDRGIGLPRTELDRVFDRFYRAPNATPGTTATGLGLALCRGLVEAHGGRIWAESQGEGQGSRFRFTVPRSPAQTREGADACGADDQDHGKASVGWWA